MSREVEIEHAAARSAYSALVATIGRPRNAAERKRLQVAEERLRVARTDLDAERVEEP